MPMRNMKHFKETHLTEAEALKLIDELKSMTKNMENTPFIACSNKKWAWNPEIMCNDVVEADVHLIGYFYDHEWHYVNKLAETLEEVS